MATPTKRQRKLIERLSELGVLGATPALDDTKAVLVGGDLKIRRISGNQFIITHPDGKTESASEENFQQRLHHTWRARGIPVMTARTLTENNILRLLFKCGVASGPFERDDQTVHTAQLGDLKLERRGVDAFVIYTPNGTTLSVDGADLLENLALYSEDIFAPLIAAESGFSTAQIKILRRAIDAGIYELRPSTRDLNTFHFDRLIIRHVGDDQFTVEDGPTITNQTERELFLLLAVKEMSLPVSSGKWVLGAP
ncbi:MAG: hypothetical protein AAFV29_12130 [Myxococcota bacterium]